MLAKTQNLYNSQEEFVPVQFETKALEKPIPQEEPQSVFAEKQEIKLDIFSLPTDFWSNLTSDKGVAQEIEKIIAQEVESRVKVFELKNAEVLQEKLVELELQQKDASEKKQKEGFEAGFQEGTRRAQEEFESQKQKWISECEALKSDMNQWVKGLIEEKHALLTAHEGDWLNGMSVLMKKFLVNQSGQVENGLKLWLETEISHFRSEEKLKILVPPVQFERLKKVGLSDSGEKLEVSPDSSLENNQFKVEAKSGGVFFSPDEQISKLEKLIADCLNSKE